MRVLVACEFSGVVREAFRRRGHDAYSCDVLPWFCLKPEPGRHLERDVRPLLREEWDLVIAHPPCTYLTKSGIPFLNRPGRRYKMTEACEFFRECLAANAPRVAVENPIPCREAVGLIGRKYDQIVHPWQFGHGDSKPTCLWLIGLPRLLPTKIVSGRAQTGRNLSPSPRRSMRRSVTYTGIAEAMAKQWGSL